jgi:lactoylglutathione lyase
MPSDNVVPITDLFEAHLTVTDLDRAVGFYRDQLALPLAHVVPERRVAFFWIGRYGKAMLGLWEAGTMPIKLSLHTAFQVNLSDLRDAPAKLRRAGIEPRDLKGVAIEEPVVLAWMPAASVYFQDPDNNLLEFITMLPDAPRPELGLLSWGEWLRRKPLEEEDLTIEPFRGSRSDLLPLFKQADDSPIMIASYIQLGEVLVARRGKDIIGHIQIVGNGAEREIRSIAVLEQQRGQGVGAALVRAVLEQAFSVGISRVSVATATADIDNLRFYQRIGFRMERVERNAFTVDHGYSSLEVDGICLHDRVWLSIDVTDRLRAIAQPGRGVTDIVGGAHRS